MIADDRKLNDYEIDNEDNLVILSKVKLPTECSMTTSAGKNDVKLKELGK